MEPGIIEIRPTVAMFFFGGKYDLIQLHRQIIHQNDEKLIEIFTTNTF